VRNAGLNVLYLSGINNNVMKVSVYLFLFVFTGLNLHAEDGHDLWLRNKSSGHVNVECSGNSPTLSIAIQELQQGWQGADNAKVVLIVKKDKSIKYDGFKISRDGIQANTDLGILYGVYELLRRQQSGEPFEVMISNPSYEVRVLNHWDNPNGTIERGYADH